MKKGILLLLLSLLFLTGCGNEKETGSSVKESESSQITSKSKEAVEKTTSSKEKDSSISLETTETKTMEQTTQTTTSSPEVSQTLATQATVDANVQRCPDYNEMTPEAKAEMERYYDGNDNGIPDNQETADDIYEDSLPSEEYQDGGDPAVQAETQRLQLEWARQQGYL